MRPGAPLWLAHPSRFAGGTPTRARWLLALIAALMLASLTALVVPAGAVADSQADELIYDSIVADLRHGADYYVAAASALRTGDHPLRPFLTFRLPTLAVVQSWISPVVAALLLYALALLTLLSWWVRLGDAFPRLPPRAFATLLATAGMVSAVNAELIAFHDIWAGLLIALSLAARRPGRWATAAALGLSATLIRETAGLYVAIMAGVALLDGERREAAGWFAALGFAAIVLFFHAQAVAGVVRPLDQPSPDWAGMLGFGFAIEAVVRTTALALAPPAIGAIAAGLALAGWAAWRDPLATRALATLLAYLMLLSFVGRPDTIHWAFLIAPIAPIGLAFLPDAILDLRRAALDRRRVTVTRVTR